MTRPPELVGLEPFYVPDAITSAFNGFPSVFGLTALLDGLSPTWRIKSMSRQRVGPTLARKLWFSASVVNGAVKKFELQAPSI
ncbi:MAG: hypothetical protein DWI29_04750 [Planctomycetota bacterium]|nr:MAG: hypothetical protein DWI29_04750 [Planctomycetota bacterium]